MTLKKNLENELDDRWRSKGGQHRCAVPAPDVCPDCGGDGYEWLAGAPATSKNKLICKRCDGTGEVWE